jgi:hypothetical protein
MPSPVGHTLAGCCLAAALRGRPGLRRPAFGAALLIAANLPDIDVVGLALADPAAGFHQGGTHSALFVLGGALALALLVRGAAPLLQAWGWLAAAGLVHLGLDLVNHDSLPPIGLPLAWPFSEARWHSAVTLFPGTDRDHPFNVRNLRELAAELAWLLPPLAFLLRDRIARLFHRGAGLTATAAPDDTRTIAS